MADEDNKADETAPDQDAAIPEVEAEIVEADAPVKPSGAFVEDEEPANPEEPAAAEKPAPRMPFTPGVILFFAFAAVAISAFVVWRLQGNNDAPPDEITRSIEETAPATAAPNDETISPDIVEGDAGPAMADAADPVSESAPADAEAAGPDSANAADPGKIANDAASAIKDAGAELDPVTELAEGDDVFLPPLGADNATAGGNRALQQAAKEALREFGPASEEGAPSTPPNTDVFDFSDDDNVGGETTSPAADAEASLTLETEPLADVSSKALADTQGATSDDATIDLAQLAQAEAAAEKLRNELSALKESFAAERAQLTQALEDERGRNARQQEEMSALRQEFQKTLSTRDAQASTEVEAMRNRLEKIRNDEIAPVERKVAGAVALQALEQAVKNGASFTNELNQLEQAAPAAPDIAALRPYAEAGLASLPSLKARFDETAPGALAAAGKEQAKGFWGAIGAQAQSVISVRPAAPQTGDSAGAVMSRAEFAVEQDDIAGALLELSSLPPNGREAMARWIADAEAHTQAVIALENLNTLIFGALQN